MLRPLCPILYIENHTFNDVSSPLIVVHQWLHHKLSCPLVIKRNACYDTSCTLYMYIINWLSNIIMQLVQIGLTHFETNFMHFLWLFGLYRLQFFISLSVCPSKRSYIYIWLVMTHAIMPWSVDFVDCMSTQIC